jgi:hypothetical protein
MLCRWEQSGKWRTHQLQGDDNIVGSDACDRACSVEVLEQPNGDRVFEGDADAEFLACNPLECSLELLVLADASPGNKPVAFRGLVLAKTEEDTMGAVCDD